MDGAPFKGFTGKQDALVSCKTRPVGSSGGSVKWYNTEKGFGFIVPEEGGKDIFFNIKDVEGQQVLQSEEKVIFFLVDDAGKQKATKVAPLNPHPLVSQQNALFPTPAPAFGGYPPPAPGPYPQYGRPPPPQPYGAPPYGAPPPQPGYAPYSAPVPGYGAPPPAHYGAPAPSSYGAPPPSSAGVRTGTCKWYNVQKEFGFILAMDGGKDIYFSKVSPPPSEGDQLEYVLAHDASGKPIATNVVQLKNKQAQKRKVMDQPYDPFASNVKVQRPGPVQPSLVAPSYPMEGAYPGTAPMPVAQPMAPGQVYSTYGQSTGYY